MQVEIRSYSKHILFVILCCITCNSACSVGDIVATVSTEAGRGAQYLLSAAHAVIGTKIIVGCAAGAVGLYAAKALYQHYFTLPDIKDALTPPAGEDLARRRKKLYTWCPAGLDLSTLEQMRAAGATLNDSALITALRRDCVRFDIFRTNDAANNTYAMPIFPLQPIESGNIRWCDLIATINYEIRELEGMKEYLRIGSRWRIFGERYCLGAARDLNKAFQAQGYNDQEQQRQMSSVAENAVDRIMMSPVRIPGRVAAWLFGAPNYDTMYHLYWLTSRRIAWMETLKGIVDHVAADQGFTHVVTTQHRPAAYRLDPDAPVQIHGTGERVQP